MVARDEFNRFASIEDGALLCRSAVLCYSDLKHPSEWKLAIKPRKSSLVQRWLNEDLVRFDPIGWNQWHLCPIYSSLPAIASCLMCGDVGQISTAQASNVERFGRL